MPRYFVTEWDARYEVNDKGGTYRDSQSKRAGPLEFIRLKVHGRSLGLGWRKLIAAAGRREAPGVFGIFCKLLELAGDADRDARGFVDDTGETPLDFILDLDRKQIDAALKVLCQVGWLIPAGAEKEERTKEEKDNSTQYNTTQHSGEFPGVPGVSGKFPEKRFTPPSPQEVAEYSKSIDFDIDGEEFVAFYASKGWRVGSTPMKDWKAAVVTWKKRHAKEQPHVRTTTTPRSSAGRDILDQDYGTLLDISTGEPVS